MRSFLNEAWKQILETALTCDVLVFLWLKRNVTGNMNLTSLSFFLSPSLSLCFFVSLSLYIYIYIYIYIYNSISKYTTQNLEIKIGLISKIIKDVYSK